MTPATKQELVLGIIKLTEEFEPKVSDQDRRYLENRTGEWLADRYNELYLKNADERKDRMAKLLFDQAVERGRQEAERDNAGAIAAEQAESQKFYRKHYLDQIFSISYKGKRPVRNIASENLVISWLHPSESMSVGWFLKVLNEQPELAEQLQWRPAGFDQDKVDQNTFNNCAKLYHYSINSANFGLLLKSIGSGMTQADIENAIRSGVQLAPATQEELDEWRSELIEAHNEELQNMSIPDLRVAARQESSDRRAQQATAEANENIKATEQRDAAVGFPPLPADFTKEVLRNAPSDKLKFWIKKFGNGNINARLQGRG